MNKFKYIVFILLFFVIGFILGLTIKSPFIDSIRINNEIDLLVILEILVTLIVAFYIASIFQKRIEQFRVEKNFLIEKLKLLDEHIDYLIDYTKNDELELTELNKKVKKIYYFLKHSLKFSEKIKLELKKNYEEKFLKVHRSIRDLATTTPKINDQGVIQYTDSLPLIIKEGFITYSQERKGDLEIKLEEFKFLVFQFIFEINRA